MVAGLAGTAVALGTVGVVGAGPAAAAGEVLVDDWNDLVMLSLAGTTPVVVRLVADVQSQGANGLVVPTGGAWVIDLAGHALTISSTSGPGVTVEQQPSMASILVRDSSPAGSGVLTTSGSAGGAGIGGAFARDAGSITIESGTIRATGGGGGAGIGGGAGGSGGTVAVTGGTVVATGSSFSGSQAAAIGAGALDVTAGTLTVAGAQVPGMAALAGTEPCLAAPAFAPQPGLFARVEATTTPDCSVTVRVAAGELPLVTSTGPDAAQVGEPFAGLVTATGSPAPTFSVSAGTLPPGLALDAAGHITGTPTAPGTFPVTLTVTNQILDLAQTATAAMTFAVAAAALAVSAPPTTPVPTPAPAPDPTPDIAVRAAAVPSVTVPAPAPAPAPAQAPSSGVSTHPLTGSEPGPLLLVAVLLLAAGAALVGAGRRGLRRTA